MEFEVFYLTQLNVFDPTKCISLTQLNVLVLLFEVFYLTQLIVLV